MAEYVVVDAYNIINDWPALKRLKEVSFEDARIKLLEIMLNYQGASGRKIILVYDAHQVKGGLENKENVSGLEIVFTKEGETADNYIEKLVGTLSRRARVFVATSDWVEQSIILQRGAFRITARELALEISRMVGLNMEYALPRNATKSNILQSLPDEIKDKLERWRRGNV